MNKLEIHGLSKVFQSQMGPVTALENIHFDVKEGEFISIVGTSGCGKSTLLNIISGLESHTTGEILLDQIPVQGPGSDRAVVFQSDATFPWLTVYENIEYGLKVKKIDPKQRKQIVEELLSLLELDKFSSAYPKELSGGMRKRIDIGRAYAVQPEILLMDEPFGALDIVTREMMQDELLRIWSERKKTVIFITHDLEEAMYLSDRIILLSPRPGRIKEVIPIDFPRPRSGQLRESQEFYQLRNQLRHIMGQ
ncbi:NitT/TauT family transport system ATP-binding protein [Seinonella peptonophila]|uniref:NitT/TauT family transport system ATP-binding protein n=1 Tax=Seinonella peptonophila TaxID=112248 RepID=A0A1M4TY49_9BACL|nr:ABC transporter ATP-binding protein [Seinonella peptonophila]SHE49257.1 NitT/TauT family transport system ATP-binding protein [Seinonella peptonophila]